MSKLTPAALPPCCYRNRKIEAVYAARFIVLPWEALATAAADVSPSDDLGATLDFLLRVSAEGCATDEVDRFLEIYQKILDSAGLMKEELSHHQDLVESPAWGLINGICVCERLQILKAQSSASNGESERALALGAAAQLHLFRRLLFIQIMPVVELLHVISEIGLPENQNRPVQRLNELAIDLQDGLAGEAVIELLQALHATWLGPGDVDPSRLETVREFVLSALRRDVVTADGWTTSFDEVWKTFSSGSPRSGCVEFLRREVDKGPPERMDTAKEAFTIPSVVLRYLVHTRGGGIVTLLARLMLGRFGRSMLSFFRSLASVDPYSLSRLSRRLEMERPGSIPGLRVLQQEKNLIIDPLALVARLGGRRVNHPGIENLFGRVRDHQGYVADHFILRRAIEAWIDPEARWTPHIEDFMRRWIGLEADDGAWPRVEAVIEEIDELAHEIASHFARIADLDTIPGNIYAGCLDDHERARQTLHRHLREGSPCRDTLFSLLHGFYIHGL